MGASAKREKRVKMRKSDQKQTGKMKKARSNPVLNSEGETDEAAQKLAKKKFTTHDLKSVQPMNDTQASFIDAYFEGTPVILTKGPAGTAKTFLSLYCALYDAFDDTLPEIDKVVVIRSAVEVRKQGWLPGEQSLKDAPYEVPYEFICNELMPEYKNAYEHLKALGYLEFQTTAYLRGITFHRSVVILDEIENSDYDEISTVITRLGDFSRFIGCGDMRQNDLSRHREQSGIDKFERVASKMGEEYSNVIEYKLDDIVRSGVVKQFLIADYHNN